MSESTFLKIKETLDKNKIVYEAFEHKPVVTSEDAARVRGCELSAGVKAMILKHDKEFVMVTLSADKKIDLKKVKKQLSIDDIRFATLEEVQKVIDCERGGVPPFGFLFGIQTLVDKRILDNKEIEFNAGLTTKSIKMTSQDYFNVAENFEKSADVNVLIGEFAQ